MRTIRFLILFALISIVPDAGRADNNGGSTYSRYGFGDLRYFVSNRGFALGNSGIAIMSPLSVDRVNPAAWAALDRTRFSVGALYEGFQSDDGLTTAHYGKTNFNGMILSLPISAMNGISLTMGITPFSKVNYNILDEQSQQGINYAVRYTGEGGLEVGHIGASVRIGDRLAFGLKLNYNFGTITQTIKQTPSVASLSGTEVIHTQSYHGIGISAGATYSGLGAILGLPPAHSLNLAGVFTNRTWMKVRDERVQSYSTGILIPQDTTLLPESKVALPYAIAVGLAYSTDRVMFVLDYQFQPWSELPVASFSHDALRNSQHLGGGFELLPKRDPLSPFSERMAFRIGAYSNASYYVLDGQAIDEWGITGGIGFPIWGESRINIGAQYGWRGTTDYNLQKDNILRVNVSANISEFWFNSPQEE